MGNHDYGPVDYYSMCPWKLHGLTHAGNQKTNCAPEKYHMQDLAYYYRFDELKFEFIGVDTNKVDCPHGIGGDGKSSYFTQCGGSGPACAFLGKVMDASAAMLQERRRDSTAESIFVIQHYDGQC